MASDVHAALCEIVAVHGNMSTDAAAAFWDHCTTVNRYQRDVWAI
jgi:sulfite reductase alpha subunit-like flavoprotein